jgi:hypothetical protein
MVCQSLLCQIEILNLYPNSGKVCITLWEPDGSIYQIGLSDLAAAGNLPLPWL